MIDEEPAPEEKVIALDAYMPLLKKLAECADNIKFWRNEDEKVKEKLSEIMGDATVGTVGGAQVLTYRFEDRFRGADFKKMFPDTYRSFVSEVTEKRFDLKRFRAARPEQYEQFRVRSMRSTFEA